MAESHCQELLKFLPKISEFEDLRSTYIANWVFNSFLSYTAIMLNIVTIHAIRKTSSLQKPLKALLLSLAVSDVGVRLLAHTFYISLLVHWLQQNNPDCIFYRAFFIVIDSFTLASFCGVVAISMDRFLAIHLHLRYQQFVTHKRVVAVVISIWLFSVFLPFNLFWLLYDIYSLIFFVFAVTCLLLTTIVYCKIYFVLQRHKNQIQALQLHDVLQASQNGDMANYASVQKSAVSAFYVYLVFLICYFPINVVLLVYVIHGPSLDTLKSFLFTYTLLFLNSSLNPVIYCWKMRHVRHAIMNILRSVKRRHRSNHPRPRSGTAVCTDTGALEPGNEEDTVEPGNRMRRLHRWQYD